MDKESDLAEPPMVVASDNDTCKRCLGGSSVIGKDSTPVKGGGRTWLSR